VFYAVLRTKSSASAGCVTAVDNVDVFSCHGVPLKNIIKSNTFYMSNGSYY
jgi:hypothetical protein